MKNATIKQILTLLLSFALLFNMFQMVTVASAAVTFGDLDDQRF